MFDPLYEKITFGLPKNGSIFDRFLKNEILTFYIITDLGYVPP